MSYRTTNLDRKENLPSIISDKLIAYKKLDSVNPLLICDNSLNVLKDIPDNYFDFCMTSPPYWSHREYSHKGIGLENKYQDYINNIVEILVEVKRVLKNTGSLWLNIGDTYINKHLVGIPWRIVFKLTDEHGSLVQILMVSESVLDFKRKQG